MKVLIFAQQWEPEDGTPQRRWAQLTNGLVCAGHQVDVIAAPPHYPGGQLSSNHPDHAPGAVALGKHGETVWRSNFVPHDRSLINRVKDQGVVAFSSFVLGLQIVKASRPDIILTTAPPIPSAVIAAAVAKLNGIPYLVDLRDVWPDLLKYMNEWGNFAEANPQNKLKALAFDSLILAGGNIFGWTIENANGVVTTTPSFAEKLREDGLARVLNVRNMASVRPAPLPNLAETEANEGEPRALGTLRILYAGTTGRAQGLDSAFDALRITVEAGIDAEMHVVGSGAHLRLLELHAERDNLPVTFLGRIPFEEVEEQYKWCDTSLIHLRHWTPLEYTVPSKLYESLSIGRHVTVAANGEAARIINETGAGDAVPAMDPKALAQLWIELANDRARLDVGMRGRDWLLERETPEQNSQKFTDFVEGTVEAPIEAPGRRFMPLIRIPAKPKSVDHVIAYAANTASKFPLLSQTVSRLISEDPILFAVQFARRFPKQLRSLLAKAASTGRKDSTAKAFIEFISDHPESARRTLSAMQEGQAESSRLVEELRVQLALPIHGSSHSGTQARSSWANGNVQEPVDLASGALQRRFQGEVLAHRVGHGIVLPEEKREFRPSEVDSNLRVYHFLTNSLPWTRSGYTFRSQSVLEAQLQAGISVRAATRLAYPTLIGRPWAGTTDEIDGVVYERLEPRKLPLGVDQRLVLQAELLKQKVKQFQPHVLHTTTNFHNGLTVDAVSRALGIPWVYEMRGNMEQSWIARQPAHLQAELLQSERYLGMRRRETEMALRANHVIVLAQVQALDLESRGVPAEKITVIPNSVDAALLEVPRDPVVARHKLGLPEGFWVGSVTAVVDYEGLPTLLEAVAILRSQGVPAYAAIVGDGVALPELRKLTQTLGIEEYTFMPGRLPQPEALRWYEALDVFVIPRRDTEVTRSVTPIKGLQAMALGIPLVVSDLPALTEISTANGQGIAVPPENAHALAEVLQAICSHRELGVQMSTAGRRATKEKTWKSSSRQYSRIYEEITRN